MENVDKQTARIRIKDIAQMAEVSVGTVDRVLHGRTGVSEASRKKVENILKQLDYQPNMYASALASNKKVCICLPAAYACGRRLLGGCGKRYATGHKGFLRFQYLPAY